MAFFIAYEREPSDLQIIDPSWIYRIYVQIIDPSWIYSKYYTFAATRKVSLRYDSRRTLRRTTELKVRLVGRLILPANFNLQPASVQVGFAVCSANWFAFFSASMFTAGTGGT